MCSVSFCSLYTLLCAYVPLQKLNILILSGYFSDDSFEFLFFSLFVFGIFLVLFWDAARKRLGVGWIVRLGWVLGCVVGLSFACSFFR